MFVLGLTGPTGSGKTFAASIFSEDGFTAVNADEIARRTVEKGTPCLRELAEAFGDGILNADGTLNRKKLAFLAFSDKKGVRTLNFITHPHIIKEIKSELSALEQKGAQFVLLDAPALYESGAEKVCSRVLAVTAPEEARLSRIMARDSLTREEASLRMKAQQDVSFYTERADYVIHNDEGPDRFAQKIQSLSARLKAYPA